MPSRTQKNDPSSQGSLAYQHLRQGILRGEFAPGDRLPAAELQEKLQIGLTPIREALMRLSSEGLVEVSSHRGARVNAVSTKGFADLVRTRMEIESLCLQHAIALGDYTWEASIVAAMHLLERTPLPETSDSPEAVAWEAAHRAFHFTLVSACGSEWLLRFWNTLMDHSERYRAIRILERRNKKAGVRDINGEHKAIMEAVLARNVERAISLMSDHLKATENAIMQLMGEHSETENKHA